MKSLQGSSRKPKRKVFSGGSLAYNDYVNWGKHVLTFGSKSDFETVLADYMACAISVCMLMVAMDEDPDWVEASVEDFVIQFLSDCGYEVAILDGMLEFLDGLE